MNLQWRAATPADVPEITRIANAIHVALPERPDVFAEKICLSPQTSLALQGDTQMIGYAIVHPWESYRIPALDSFLEKLPHPAGCLYIHDIAVLPEFRGKQAVASAVRIIAQLAQAREIRFLALVSVYQTTAMWERFGFRVTDVDLLLTTKLLSYGDTAKYMICDLHTA